MKYMRKQLITILVFLALFFSTVPHSIFAAAYGEGSYGEGKYDVGEVATSNSSSGSNSGSSGGGSNTSCSAAKPSSVPDLFQINAKVESLTLFFTPSSNNRDRYYVSYGTKTGEYQYGFEFTNNENGVISVDIGALQKNTTYYFKVRAGNGCQPGDWSNELAAKTGQRFPTYRWSSIPQIVTTRVTRTLNPSSVSKIEIDASKEEAPSPAQQQEQKIETKSQTPKQSSTPQPTPSTSPEPEQQESGGFWQWFLNLFR